MNPNDRRVPSDTRRLPYIEHSPDSSRFSPALRQALIATAPDYFSWPSRQQDQFRRDMPGDVHALLDQRLDEATACEDRCEMQRSNTVNRLKLPLFGIGQDCYFLNEPGSDWNDMATVADLSRAHFEADPDREENKRPFMGQFYPAWCRYLRKEDLVYSTLTSFHHHVLDNIAERHDALIAKLIPYRFVKGSKHGKQSSGGYLWDMKRDAGGLEGQLDALMECAWKIQNALYLQALDDSHARNSGQVFRLVKSDGVDPMSHWIFDGLRAMQHVRLTHFLTDVQNHRASRRTLSTLLQSYLAEAETRLHQEHSDIMQHWNPTLARFKRKRKIILSMQAAEELLDEE